MLFRQFVRLTKRFFGTNSGAIITSKIQDVVLSKTPVHEYVWQKNAKFSDRVALECLETGSKYTYNELYSHCKSLSFFLSNRLKLNSRETAAIILPNIPEYAIVLLGSMQSNVIVSTFNPNYTVEEIKKQLLIANPKVVFTTKTLVENVKNAIVGATLHTSIIEINERGSGYSPGVISFKEIISNRTNEPLSVVTDADNVALLPFSSGTTGQPKGVQLSHFNLVSNLLQYGVPEFDPLVQEKDIQDVVTGFLPFFHIYGLTVTLLFALTRGAKIVPVPKFTSDSYVTMLRNYHPTVVFAVPPIVLLTISNEKIKSEHLSGIRTMVSGAAPLGAEDIERLYAKARRKVNLLQAYGMTETSPLVVSQTPALPNGVKIGGSGFLIPNTSAKIVSIDDPNRTLGPRESGQLLVKGPQNMVGYFNNSQATNEMIQPDGWLRTGDIAYYDEHEHFFITDRLKELIKVKGFQVAPAELEEVIRGHPDVNDVGVVGIPHATLGEAPKAFVVLKENAKRQPETIREFVKQKLSKEKHLVGGVTFVEAIPRNASGKLMRRELKKLA